MSAAKKPKPSGRVCRVRRNTGPIGGPWVCEVGFWIEDTLRGTRDRFHVTHTVKVGTRAECEQAAAQAAPIASAPPASRQRPQG